MVFIWHGFGAFGENIVNLIDDAAWPEAIRVAPKGMPRTFEQFGDIAQVGWQIQAGEYEDRDLAFFDALLYELTERGCIDPKRVFTTGFSNGGFFSHVLACHRPDRLVAAAPVGGGGPFEPCREAVPVLMQHGRKDRVVPFRMAEESFESWRAHNGCEATPLVDGVGCTAPLGCRQPVEFCAEAGGHQWPKPAAKRIVAFFKRTLAAQK